MSLGQIFLSYTHTHDGFLYSRLNHSVGCELGPKIRVNINQRTFSYWILLFYGFLQISYVSISSTYKLFMFQKFLHARASIKCKRLTKCADISLESDQAISCSQVSFANRLQNHVVRKFRALQDGVKESMLSLMS